MILVLACHLAYGIFPTTRHLTSFLSCKFINSWPKVLSCSLFQNGGKMFVGEAGSVRRFIDLHRRKHLLTQTSAPEHAVAVFVMNGANSLPQQSPTWPLVGHWTVVLLVLTVNALGRCPHQLQMDL